MLSNTRNSTAILKDILEINGVEAVLITGRDGFVIESRGASHDVQIDALGACLANAINSLDQMGSEMGVDSYRDMFVEYGKAVILSRPIGDAIVALVSPDASTLGVIRYQLKNYARELEALF
ncbi:MAG: roadblock/LC7 domain-containing protein [Deltaproteobacteria bacterium]|nr:roadblock/LC7 domain-containing protein [Deltaproteobacteria bacterium]